MELAILAAFGQSGGVKLSPGSAAVGSCGGFTWGSIGVAGLGPLELISTIGAVMAMAEGVITIELLPTVSEMFVVAFSTIVPPRLLASMVAWPPTLVLQLPPIA